MVGKPVPQKPKSTSNVAASTGSASGREEQKTYALAEPTTPSLAEVSASAVAEKANESRVQKSPAHASGKSGARLVSLDAFRGFIMMMLAANGFGLLAFSRIPEDSPVWEVHDREAWNALGWHFDHPKWVSSFNIVKVSFWDLIQPSFMFMVGVAMPYSYARRASQGHSRPTLVLHALIRSVVLVLMGVFLSSIGKERTTWVFPNVLCQIGLGYFFASLLLNRSRAVQFSALAVILVGCWGWFALNPPPADYDYAAVGASKEKGEILEGRFAAWSKNANVAFYFDQWLLPKLRSAPVETTQPSAEIPATSENDPPEETAPAGAAEPGWIRRCFFSSTEPYTPNSGGYTTLNFVPSIGTTLLGILCGQLLMAPSMSRWGKLGILIGGAAVCFGLGVAADMTVCPVVKRIWTPSWVLFSGGYVIGMLALFYLLFDIAPLKLLAFPLVVVGMNSILTYMLGQTMSGWMKNSIVQVHLAGIIEQVFGPKALDPQWYGPVTMSTTVFLLYWLFLLWLYRQRIFLRI
jgi:predicted acyltransferase